MTHLLLKKIELFYCFHVAAILFMSLRPILGHFLLIFYCFSSKLPGIAVSHQNANFSFKIVMFLSFWILLYLSGSKFYPGGGATFNFRTILADFHEYTLNMTSYHVTE